MGSKLLVTLGLPLKISPQKRCTDFKYILENLEAKLMDWRSKTLCWVGRGRLINSVIQAIPNYVMSFRSILAKTWNKMDALAHKFWWKQNGFEGRFLTLLAWDNLCKPKCKGGLGFKKNQGHQQCVSCQAHLNDCL